MGYYLSLQVYFKEEVGQEVNDHISDLPKKEGEFLTIANNSVDEGYCIFEQGMYLSVLHCL